MSGTKANLKALYERRDRLRLDIAAAKARLEEVEDMIRLMGGEAPPDPPAPSQAVGGQPRAPRRGDLKDVVLALCEEAGEAGLTAAECVALAQEKRGITLQPASVSSLLSRLKADDTLFYDGARYRLKRFAGARNAA